jgi:hypothetical protein
MIIPNNMESHKIHVPNHQPEGLVKMKTLGFPGSPPE